MGAYVKIWIKMITLTSSCKKSQPLDPNGVVCCFYLQ